MKSIVLIISFLLLTLSTFAQNYKVSGTVLGLETGNPLEETMIIIQSLSIVEKTAEDGTYELELPAGKYTFQLVSVGMQTLYKEINLQSDIKLDFYLEVLNTDLGEVEVRTKKKSQGIIRLERIDGLAIYDGKKNEVIVLDDFAVNKASNNARQVFAKVPGLNIWESDFAGLQLDIAARGLGPSRTANFNTRQNGYDMSADALGYPESYYMPALQAVERIEVVRGASSLQYGPQFGGMLNFKMKEAPDSLELNAEQSIGSFGLLNSYFSIGTRNKKVDFFAYYQFREGDGWRDNSGFNAHTAFGRLGYKASKRLKIGLEYSFLNYVAQQPGGVTDDYFTNGDLTQSLRNRNWFRVDWNLIASTIDYDFDENTKLNIRSFTLISGRQALGNLQQIGVLDNPFENRTLISDQFKNFGSEARLLHEFRIKKKKNSLLTGFRYYRGLTERKQGLASADSTADFNLLNPNDPEEFDYDFPSENFAFFVENLIDITKKWSATAGARIEHIRTDAMGMWKLNRYNFAGDLVSSDVNHDQNSTERWVPLFGFGTSYILNKDLQIYSNYSKNFRSITFSDLRVVNPNFQLDSLITDENGYNIDLGIRGELYKWINIDASVFLLRYNNRIGQYELPSSTTLFKTNIGDSRHFGFEFFSEMDVLKLVKKEKDLAKLTMFVNLSMTNAVYVESDILAIQDKRVEYVPNVMLRTGINYKWKKLKTTFQYSYLGDQYSDATNSEFNPNALTGIVPSYMVMDLSVEYQIKRFKLSGGINNLSNEVYFTRRAESYPGPGIIPATPRSFYFALALRM